MKWLLLSFLIVKSESFTSTHFHTCPLPRSSNHRKTSSRLHSSSNKNDAIQQAEQLLAKAKAIRESLPKESTQETIAEKADEKEEEDNRIGYRLYIDIGREEGTWMDPKWGKSGARIEGSIDIYFQIPSEESPNDCLADQEIVDQMVKDNLSGTSTVVRKLDSNDARLRGGFDSMKCNSGGYRIDVSKKSSSTVRFFISVDGTEEDSRISSFGDIFIPRGNLYFSLPVFGNSVKQLSMKEGIITVRQMGWHTGWRREESRIVGVFRAKPIEEARRKDKF